MVTTATKTELYRQETGEAFIFLITIEHPDLDQTIYAAGDATEVVSRGNTYTPYPFNLQLPTSDPDSPPRARLTIDNVDRRIVRAIRALTSAPTITFEMVRSSAPDTVELSMPNFTLQSATYDALVVQGDLSVESFVLEPYPADIFDPARFPGGF